MTDNSRKLHHDRATELLTHLAAEFVERQSNGTSLITVTRAEVAATGASATVYVSVFPDDRAPQAVEFLNRNAGEFRDYVKKNARMRDLPHVTFAFDSGEKNRQRLDELTNQ